MTHPKAPRKAFFIATGLLLLLSCLLTSVCVGDEVELTNEWQLLGENDTLPKGAHVRMDLSTGGRWAKLNQDDDQENQVEIDASGGIISVKEEEKRPSESQFDFDVMHRALSHLPEEEKERMGGLPDKPADDAGPEVKRAFEERMKEIWTQRQAELQKLQEETMADLPKLLLERIARLDEYLQDPHSELSQVWKDDNQEGEVTHVASVVQDLEGHFTDIDVTRDFHTLGGWPLLVSLMSDQVHQSPNATLTPEQVEKVNEIQSNAAWAIGTAVKNIGEFASWGTEELSIDGIKTTPIELFLNQLKVDDINGPAKKFYKILYALGSLLRGNRMAQAHFCAAGGPTVLGKMLSTASQDPASADVKATKRILALADDIVSDVTLHPYEQDEDIDKLIVASFSADDWCEPPIRFLERDVLQETALETIQALEPFCNWEKGLVRTKVTTVKEQRHGDDHIVELADSILNDL